MSHSAVYAKRNAYLSTEFGEAMALRYFKPLLDEHGITLDDIFGRYVRGKNKGKLRGVINWVKVEKGGWCRNKMDKQIGASSRGVENRVGKVIQVEICLPPWGEPEVVMAEWAWFRDEQPRFWLHSDAEALATKEEK